MNRRMALVLMAALTFVFGCIAERRLSPVTRAPMKDVPVPSPFKFDAKHSTDYRNEAMGESISNTRYTGSAKFVDVVAFYKEQMPLEGWRLLQDVGSGDRRTLSFGKGGEMSKPGASTCVVTIQAGWGDNATAIQISRVER